MTKQEIANWIREWFKQHPYCQDLTEMYEDFSSYFGMGRDVGELTKLIYKLNPLKHMTYIPDGMFYNCAYTEVVIPNHITSIGAYVFKYCSGLTSITIPNRVTSIGEDAFYYCIGLTSIHFDGTVAEWNAITKGSGWNYSTGKYTVYCTDGNLYQ